MLVLSLWRDIFIFKSDDTGVIAEVLTNMVSNNRCSRYMSLFFQCLRPPPTPATRTEGNNLCTHHWEISIPEYDMLEAVWQSILSRERIIFNYLGTIFQ